MAGRERRDHGEDAGTGRTSPPSAELAEQGDRPRPGPDLLGPEEDPDRDGQVEGRAGLAQLGGREVDGDAPRREGEPGVADGAADAFARLLDGGVAEPDDR